MIEIKNKDTGEVLLRLDCDSLEGADLRGQNLTRANLKGAHLKGARLAGACLAHAVLGWADLRGVDLRRADLRQADLRKADLRRADLRDSQLQRAQLQQAIVFQTDFRRANLQGAKLWEMSLNGNAALFRQADLRNAHFRPPPVGGQFLDPINLRNADLQEAQLNGLDLGRADLQGADLRGACMTKAILTGASLRGANLRGARLDGAALSPMDQELVGEKVQCYAANLRDADLRHVNLKATEGLMAGQLGGANIHGATLPEEIGKFEGLNQVGDLSKNAGTLFSTMLAVCAYTWLTIAATKDVQLLTNSGTAKLPIVNLDIQLDWFYGVAPVVLLGLYLYFHLYLQRLWEALAALPAVFPDGRTLDERSYPWLLSGLVYAYFAQLRSRRPALSHLQQWLSFIVGWCLVPFTLLLFWGRYLRRHDWFWSGLHIVLQAICVGAMCGFCYLTVTTLKGTPPPSSRLMPFWKNTWKRWRSRRFWRRQGRATLRAILKLWPAVVALATGAIFYVLSLGGIEGVRPDDEQTKLPSTNIRRWVPRMMSYMRYLPFLDISYEQVKGMRLRGRNLRGMKAEGTDFTGAILQEADLTGAQLVTAHLGHANLTLANLRQTNLFGSDLRDAVLRGTNLRGASLTLAKLGPVGGSSVRFLNALYDDETEQPRNFRFEKVSGMIRIHPGAHLEDTFLENAHLEDAQLQGADLKGTRLTGAHLENAHLENAHLEGKGPSQGEVTELSGAHLDGTILRGAFYNEYTHPPEGIDLSKLGAKFVGIPLPQIHR